MTGTIDHTHVDGLYPSQDAAISCSVAYSTPRSMLLRAALRVTALPRRHAVAVTALDPVVDAVDLISTQCPGQGDPIDGLFDTYFTPGFSFDSSYGPERWFTGPTIVIPEPMLRRAATVTIPLRETPRGTPPRDCAVPHPEYQRCSATGRWSGVLRLKAVR